MQGNQTQQVVGQLRAALGHAMRESVGGQLGVRQVIRFHALAEHLAVDHQAADRNAAEVDAVVGFFAADETGFAGLAFEAPIGAGHLQGGVCGLGAGAGEKDLVQAFGCEFFDFVGQLKRQTVAVLEAGGIFHGAELLGHSGGDFGARVAQTAAPQAGQAVQNFAAPVVGVIHTFGADHHARIGFEIAVAGVGHPVRVHPGRALGDVAGGGQGLTCGGVVEFHKASK